MIINPEASGKALEIAISLTKADHTCLRMDENKNVLIKEPLYTTLKTVIRTMYAENLIDITGSCGIYPDY